MVGNGNTANGNVLPSSSGLSGKHVCDVCQMAFMDTSLFSLHMSFHVGAGARALGLGPFVCAVCGDNNSANSVQFLRHIAEKQHGGLA